LSTPPPVTLSPLESELVDFFEHLTAMLSMPQSYGQLFGILYASPAPICFEEIQAKLGLSKGSVSMGLRALRDMGVIQVVNRPFDRRDFYTCEHSLRRLAEAFLNHKILPHLANGHDRIARMEQLLADQPSSDFHQSAVHSLKTWHKKANTLLPFVQRLIK
jgi:HTH-type transcriptional regulator, glycine betaine synthesis regulator